ncbi:ATP-binding protein [Streptomyces griseoaurantiacus]|uniref:ATP-binding protein n=1 Tax=Streptomyces griseoaurantiacus TaxID=68213 RepID=UPI00324E7BD9
MILISEDLQTVHVEFPNGNVIACTSEYMTELQLEDVVYVHDEQLEKAPQDAWPEGHWVGTVRAVLPEEVILDIGGNLKVMPQSTKFELKVGNTVQGTGRDNIKRILSENPIRPLGLPETGDQEIRQFKEPLNRGYSFDDFGGSRHIVDRARELIETPLEYQAELEEIGARPIKGVLFTGEPGTGKTMLARIIASNAGATFYHISGPQIMSKWVGESEESIRQVFIDAAQQKRAIIFFDEIDSLATQRSGESNEASRRLVGQLLASMDGFNSEANIIVIATTNRPQDIDVALRRPGRFDWEINFPLPTRAEREEILIKSSPSGVVSALPHALIAEKTENWSPAELAAIWSEAALLAVTDGSRKIRTEDYLGGFERVSVQRERKLLEAGTSRQDTPR